MCLLLCELAGGPWATELAHLTEQVSEDPEPVGQGGISQQLEQAPPESRAWPVTPLPAGLTDQGVLGTQAEGHRSRPVDGEWGGLRKNRFLSPLTH